MAHKVIYLKTFISGLLEGITVHDQTVTFSSLNDALAWAAIIDSKTPVREAGVKDSKFVVSDVRVV